MSKIKNIIFDLDGTLWDSRVQIIEAWKNIFPELNISVDDLNSLMGKTSDEFIKFLFPNKNHDDATNCMSKCEDSEVDYLSKHGANIYNHTIDTLKKLNDSYKLFIVSNCQKGYIDSFINYYHLNEYFTDYECNGNTGLSKADNIKLILDRNKLNYNESCYVGDTLGDYSAADINDLYFIWSRYGFGDVPNCNYYIDDISDLPAKVKSIY